jgi:hypothetical protein
VEKKEDTKDKLGRSPDGLDAMNLAYYDAGKTMGVVLLDTKPARREYDEDRRRGPYGR